MNKWIAISIISILAVGATVLGIFYFQETDKLKDTQAEITSLEGNVSALQTEVTAAEAEVSILEIELADAEAAVSTLEAQVADAEAGVSTLETELSAAEAQVSILETDLAAAEAQVAALEAELAPSPPLTPIIVTFPDSNLEAAIREVINKPIVSILQSDLEGLTMLDAQGRGISDLTGLEYCVNLQHLDLAINNISDISALAGLTNLMSLGLEVNNVSDISPLVENSGLSAGDTVDLTGNPLSTTSVNIYIPQLEARGVIVEWTVPPPTDTASVTFPDANLEAAIREAINKREGSIYTSDLEALTTLEAPERGISDLTGLEYCVNLQHLDLAINNISDISALAGLTNLMSLALEVNNVSDISPLASLINLSGLHLTSNNISDISALAGLTNLYNLSLRDNNISDISPLVENSGLSEGDIVDLGTNPLSTMSVNVYVLQLEARGVIVTYENGGS